jgi:DnaK suppressor protein
MEATPASRRSVGLSGTRRGRSSGFSSDQDGRWRAGIFVFYTTPARAAATIVIGCGGCGIVDRMGNQTDEGQVRRLLENRLAEVEEQLTSMARPPTEQSNISFGKRVGDGTQMAVDRLAQVAVHDRLQLVRNDIARALTKLNQGSYGRCDVCDEPIPPGRLEALPWAVLCLQHASRRDRS